MSADRLAITHLRAVPLFAQLSPEQLARLASIAQVLRFETGSYVFYQDQRNQGLYILVGGRAELMQRGDNGRERPVGSLFVGQYLNEGALYQEGVESASLMVVETAIFVYLARDRFVNLLLSEPEIRTNLRVPVTPEQQNVTEYTRVVSQEGRAPRVTPNRLFKGQRENETVAHIFRRHWWGFMRYSWVAILIFIGSMVAAALITIASAALGLLIAALGILIPGMVLLYLYLEWRDDCLIVTDIRLVRIHNYALRFQRKVSEVPIDRVLEVNLEIPPADPMARLFNYGSVHVRTTSSAIDLTINFIPKPKSVQQAIFNQRDRLRESVEERSKSTVQNDVARALGYAVPQTADSSQPREPAYTPVARGFWVVQTRFTNDNGELVFRRHWTVWLLHVFPGALVMLFGVGLALFSLTPLSELGIAGLSIGAFAFIIGSLWVYIGDWDWRNDLLTIGDQAITFQRKRPLWLQNQVDRIRIAQIDNVIADTSGIIGTLLNRGDVRVTLIGSDVQKAFDYVGDPQEVQAEISRRQTRLKEQAAIDSVRQQRDTIAEYLATYHQTVERAGQSTLAAPAYAQPAVQPGYAQPTLPAYPAQASNGAAYNGGTYPAGYAAPTAYPAVNGQAVPYPTVAPQPPPPQPGTFDPYFAPPGLRTRDDDDGAQDNSIPAAPLPGQFSTTSTTAPRPPRIPRTGGDTLPLPPNELPE